MNKPDPIPARLAALKTTPTPDLKKQWRDLFDSEPPPFNRRYLESRLAYRIQELAYGGLKPETIRRLEALGEELDGGDSAEARHPRRPDRADHRHAAAARMAGRRAGRHRHRRRLRMAGAALQVAVGHRARHHRHALERLGVLRAEEPPGADMTKPPKIEGRPQAALRGLHPEILRGRAGAGVQQPPRPARGLRGVHRQPAVRGLGAGPRSV